MIRFRVGALSSSNKLVGHTTPGVLMSSKEPITTDDAVRVRSLLNKDARNSAWHFVSLPPGGKYTDEYAGKRPEHFAVALLDLAAVLGPPMDDFYLDWEFTILWPGSDQTVVSYRNMIKPCTMAGQLMGGGCAWCPGCDRNGIADCRTGWVKQLLHDTGDFDLSNLVRIQSPYNDHRSAQKYRDRITTYDLDVKAWVRRQHERLSKLRTIPDDLDYVSGYYTRTWGLDAKWLQEYVRCSSTDLSEEGVARRRDKKSSAAEEAAYHTKKEAHMCKGCVREGDCHLYRRNNECFNFDSDATILAYILEVMRLRSKTFVPDDVIEKSVVIGGEDFVCANPETYRDKPARFGGFLQGGWSLSLLRNRSYDDHYRFETWRELRQWVRQWSPDTLPRLDYAEAQVGTRELTDWQRAMFTLGANRAFLRYLGGFGYVYRRVTALSAQRNLQGFSMDLEGSGYNGSYRDLSYFLMQYGWDADYMPAPKRGPVAVWTAPELQTAVRTFAAQGT
jgi:hypothetical protein